jgi:hypothetical protein
MSCRRKRRPIGRVYSSRGQLFDGAVDGRLVVARSTQPLLDACRKGTDRRRIITGVNWSGSVGSNPFRNLGSGGESLDSILAQQRAGRDEPIVTVLHLACPRVEYLDRGKSSIVIPGSRTW